MVSGPVRAEGSLKNPSALVARAGLGIAPGTRGVPVAGKLECGLQRPRRYRDPGENLICRCPTPASISRARSVGAYRSARSRAIWRISAPWRAICR